METIEKGRIMTLTSSLNLSRRGELMETNKAVALSAENPSQPLSQR